MSLLARLRALDERVVPASRWHRYDVRFWWAFLTVPALVVVVVMTAADAAAFVPLVFLGMLSAFLGGWYFGELRRGAGRPER